MNPASLTVYRCPYEKIRLGKDYDGGYVMAHVPNLKYNLLLAGGISNDISFEEDFIKRYGSRCVAFDGTISQLPKANDKIEFVKKNIGYFNNDKETNLHDLINSHDNIFVKMDIEGGEIPWLQSLSDEQMNKFNQIVMEFHCPFSEREQAVFEKINKNHVLVHFHGNNCCGTRNHKGVVIPNVFECSFLHHRLFEFPRELNTDPIPSKLDMPNTGKPEIVLKHPPFVNPKTAPLYIPTYMKKAYTLDGSIPVHKWYFNEVASPIPIVWKNDYINDVIKMFALDNIRNGKTANYGYGSTKFHLEAFEKYIGSIKGKKVAVIGSQTPWTEAILINCGAKEVTTVEYNVPQCSHNILKTMSYTDFCNSSDKYDAIVSYSSIEHSGLGRYGDPLNPNGDIETMENIYKSLNDGGLCFVGFPVGKDALVWNAHRIYGEQRLKLMYLDKFKELEWFGYTKSIFQMPSPSFAQPLIVLQK